MIRTGTLLENRYEILGKIGSGGMADVYKAKCHKLGRYVAVKVLKPEYSSDESFVAKFRAEAQAAAGLVHPNVVNVYDVGDDKNLHYIVLELVEGITLKQYIEKKGKLEIRESIGISMQIAQGMEAAHERHIVHRDIKPQNIMISKDGKVKVTDFGIAKAASAQTINSATMGSVHYISPEQARGGYCDERSDIYSLGITMYEMLTGHVPFEGDSAVAVALLHIQGEMEPPTKYEPTIPISLEKIILKCTQKKPEQRYANASLLIADLRRALMTPDEDFVKIVPIASAGPTRVMSDEEMSQIKDGYTHPEIEVDPDLQDEEQDYLLGIENDYDDEEDDGEDEDEEDDEEEEGSSRFERTAIGIFIGVAVLIVILIIYLLLQFFGIIGSKSPNVPTVPSDITTEGPGDTTEASSSKMVKMPALDDLSEDEIEKELAKVGLVPKFRYEESSTVKEGYIISQGMAKGTEVKRGSTVQIVISAGTDVRVIPEDLSGKTTEEVRTILANLDLESTVSYDYSDTVAKGRVIRTTPGEGTTVAMGRSITIYESMGKKPTVSVPTLTGKTREQAKSLLSGLKLNVVYKEENSKTVKKGYVISQSVAGGTKVDENSTLTVVISLGAESVPMPDLITGNLDYSEAVRILADLDLKVKETTETYRNDSSLGDFDKRVIIQYPEANVEVNDQSNIYLNIVRTVVEKMPKLVGKTREEAAEILKKYAMKTTVEEVPCADSERGKVIYARFSDGTNVPVNSSVAVGSSIVLTVGKGSTVTVPDVIGKSYNDAVTLLTTTYKLNVKRGEDIYSSYNAGQIARTSPAAGESLKMGDTITVYVSLGKLTMPNVVNTPFAEAEAKLKAAPYLLTVIKYEEYNSTVPAGNVINQSISTGTEIKNGDSVTLAVSKGPEPAPVAKVPSLLGMTYDVASDLLEQYGLHAARGGEAYSDTYAAGQVMGQDISNGTEVPKGTTITLTISLGPAPTEAPPEPSTEESTEAPPAPSNEVPPEPTVAPPEQPTDGEVSAGGN